MTASEPDAGAKPPAQADTDERLRFVLESAGLGTWEWDCVANKPLRTQGWGDTLGYPKEDFPNILAADGFLIHPDDQPRVAKAFAEHLSGKTHRYLIDHRIRAANGGWRWIRARAKLISHTPDGRPLHVIGTSEDITEQKQADEDHRFTADLFAELLALHDPDDIITAALRKLGAHLDAARVLVAELENADDDVCVNWEWRKEGAPSVIGTWDTASFDADFLADATAGQQIIVNDVEQDQRITRSPMLEKYRATSTVAILNAPLRMDNRLRALLIVHDDHPRTWQPLEIELVRDIAERLWDAVIRARAEVQQRAAQELLEFALDVAKLGAFEQDIAAGRQRVSRGLFALLGQDDVENVSLGDYMSIIHPDDLAEFIRKDKASRLPGSDGLCLDEHRIITSSGDIRHVSFHRQTFSEETPSGPRVVRACTIFRDVTEEHRRAVEAATVRERAQRVSRLTAMGTMASTLAHELNQPLTAAANYLNAVRAIQKAEAAPPDIDPAELLQRAIDKVLESGQIIKHIRSLSHEAPQHRALHDLAVLVDEAQAQLSERIPEGRVAVVRAFPEGLQVRVDPVQIEQVLFNLFRNAAEAMHGQDGACITVSAEPASGGMVGLHVTDNGPGMTEETVSELFNPFRPDRHGGAGLGLSLCRTMVEAHGGHLTLERHGSTGTSFLITLPAA